MSCEQNNSNGAGAGLVRAFFRTPGPQTDCLACAQKRVHTADEERIYHPFAKHGFTKEQGYTHPELARLAAVKDAAKAAAEAAKT